MNIELSGFLSGWLVLGYLVSGLFFFHFWKMNRDRLFVLFGIGFWILALQRVVVVLMPYETEYAAAPYLLRLLAFLTILFGIIDKNRPGR